MQDQKARHPSEGCLTTRCSGGHEARLLWCLSMSLVAPLNASVRPLTAVGKHKIRRSQKDQEDDKASTHDFTDLFASRRGNHRRGTDPQGDNRFCLDFRTDDLDLALQSAIAILCPLAHARGQIRIVCTAVRSLRGTKCGWSECPD